MNKIMLETILLEKIPGKENICVKPMYQMYNHQIDGVRFLFKQWKSWKNKSQMKPSDYCVLSFPPKQGKSATVLLFLNAVRALLHYPILILCKDDEEVLKWMLNLKKWTVYQEDEIAVDPNKALINKQIFIKKYSDVSKLGPFSRRSWSIVVINTDDCVSLPPFQFVEFTIWITSTELTKDLSLLKSMHNWILPKVEFEMYTHTENMPKWKNEILKHSMLESFVFIRKTASLNCQENVSFESSTERKRLKNKDATGLKVKRSKKTNNNSRDEKMDVETFIRTEIPVRSKDKDNNNCNIVTDDNANATNRVEPLIDNRKHAAITASTVNERHKETGQAVIGTNKNAESDTNEEAVKAVQFEIEKSEVDMECTRGVLKENSEMSTESNLSDIENDAESGDLEAANNDPITETGQKPAQSVTNNKIQNEVKASEEREHEDIECTREILKENSEMSTESNLSDLENDGESGHLKAAVNDPIKNTTKIADITVNKKEDEIKIPEGSEKSVVITEHTNDILKENREMSASNISDIKHNKSSDLEEESNTDVASTKNKSLISDLDSKLNEMQEKAMKKFKGSILDSIF